MHPASLILTLLLAVGPASATGAELTRTASCVKVELLDQNGLPLAGPSVVGLLIGSRTIVPEDVPPHSGRRNGTPAPCPKKLVGDVAQSYKESCLTVARRVQTAKENNTTREEVDVQCQTIRDALGESLTPYLE